MKKRLHLDLEEKVKDTFQMKCLKNKENMTTIVTKFIEAFNRDPKGTLAFINKEYVSKK